MNIESVEQFFDTYESILEILNNEVFYKKDNQTKPLPELYKELGRLLQDNEKINEENTEQLNEIKQSFEKIFNKTDDDNYIEELYNIIKQANHENHDKIECTKFIEQEKNTANTLKEILESMNCVVCKIPYFLHACNNYVHNNDTDQCMNCNVKDNLHNTCDSFVYEKNEHNKIIERCKNCNLPQTMHQSQEFCGKYEDNTFSYCKKCDRHISQHFYTEKFSKLREDKKYMIQMKQIALSVYAMKQQGHAQNFYRKFVDEINNKIYTTEYFNTLN